MLHCIGLDEQSPKYTVRSYDLSFIQIKISQICARVSIVLVTWAINKKHKYINKWYKDSCRERALFYLDNIDFPTICMT
jgi:hypothetical protein